MKSMAITVSAVALLLCLDGAPILATATPVPGKNATAPTGLIVVNTADDQTSTDDMCSLREAIVAANLDTQVDGCPAGVGDDMIILPEGRYVLQLAGASEDDNATGDLDLRSNITIVGVGSALTIIDGGGIDRVLDIHAGARVVVSGVTITNGATPDGQSSYLGVGGDAEPGGGIRNAGDLWLLGCDVSGNHAGKGGYGGTYGGKAGDGGGIYNRRNLTLQISEVAQNQAGAGGFYHPPGPCGYSTPGGNGGGIWNDGTLVSTNSTITANWAGLGFGGGIGGGIWNSGTLVSTQSTITANQARSGDGGGVWSSGTLTITHATISANLAAVGGGGGGIANTGHLSLSHSTMIANRAGVGNPGGFTCGGDPGSGGNGGAVVNSGWLSVSNCTLSGNQAGEGGKNEVFFPGEIGPGGSGGGIHNRGTAQLEYSTISANTSGHRGTGYSGADLGGDGGGIVNRAGGLMTVKGSLLAGNTAYRNGPDCLGGLASQGYNLIQDAGFCTLTGDLTGNITGQAARLEPLADNGGPTWTHALQSNSPAVDRADCLGLDGALLTTDQRDRPRPLGGACDIGAVEEWALTRFPFIAR